MAKRGVRVKHSYYSALKVSALANTVGLVSALILVISAFFSWFSDYNADLLAVQYPIPFSVYDWTLIIGILQVYVISYLAGWVFARIYNSQIK